MMRLVLLLAAVCGPALADIGLVARGAEQVPIIQESNVPSVDGRFNWQFESANGIRVSQTGDIEESRSADEPAAQVIRGEYSYRLDDGTDVVVRYVADRHGFRPESPLIPNAIVKLAEEARSLPPLPPNDPGSGRSS